MAMIFHTSRAARSSPDTPANPISNAPIFSTNKPPRIRHQTRTNKMTNVSNFLTFRDRWKDKAKANRRKSILNLKYKLHILKLTGDDEDEKYDILSTLDEYVMENILPIKNFSFCCQREVTSNSPTGKQDFEFEQYQKRKWPLINIKFTDKFDFSRYFHCLLPL